MTEQNEMIQEDVDVEVAENDNGTEADTTEVKREQKLKSWYEGENDTVLCIEVIDGVKGVMRFNTVDLPNEIKQRMVPFATLKKLGSQGACSGKKGTDAEEAIESVWTSLLNGDWTLRQPAAPKVSVKEIAANMEALSADEQSEARALLERLGLKL